LSIVNQIAKDHGGALRLESAKGSGTTAVIVLAVAADSSE